MKLTELTALREHVSQLKNDTNSRISTIEKMITEMILTNENEMHSRAAASSLEDFMSGWKIPKLRVLTATADNFRGVVRMPVSSLFPRRAAMTKRQKSLASVIVRTVFIPRKCGVIADVLQRFAESSELVSDARLSVKTVAYLLKAQQFQVGSPLDKQSQEETPDTTVPLEQLIVPRYGLDWFENICSSLRRYFDKVELRIDWQTPLSVFHVLAVPPEELAKFLSAVQLDSIGKVLRMHKVVQPFGIALAKD